MSEFMQKLKDAQAAVIDGLVSEYHKLILPLIHALESGIKDEAPAFLTSLERVAIASIQAGNGGKTVIKHVESAASEAIPQLADTLALNVLSTAIGHKALSLSGLPTTTDDLTAPPAQEPVLQTEVAAPAAPAAEAAAAPVVAADVGNVAPAADSSVVVAEPLGSVDAAQTSDAVTPANDVKTEPAGA